MYSFNSRVRFSEIDEAGILSIPAIINYLQDCSTFHSEAIGRGPLHVKETGLAWMLSAWQVEVYRRPAFNEEIRVATWATNFKGLRASRNFTICDIADEAMEHPLVRADSSWFMFDTCADKPVRIPESEYQGYLESTPALDMPPTAKILRAEGSIEDASPVVVTGAHLDTNHHVNNAQYVSLALGALEELDPELTTKTADINKPYAIDVHYAIAAKLGDTIYPHIHKADTCTYVTLDNEDTKPFATVRIRQL